MLAERSINLFNNCPSKISFLKTRFFSAQVDTEMPSFLLVLFWQITSRPWQQLYREVGLLRARN
jgi:hypothetical protein